MSAQDNSAMDDVLEEVIVTADKRGRTLMETATSVTIYDEETLKELTGIVALSDLLTRLPNSNAFGKSGVLPTVRGVDGTGPALGANAFFAGTRNRLNIQVDGRPLTYNEVAYGDEQMWDVASVQVLRGPQSTLQGRNAIGGTIAIFSNDPTYEFEGAARAVIGSENLWQGSLALSGPVIDDQLAVRLAVDHREYDSWAKMVPTVYGFNDPEHYTASTLRGKILYEPDAWDSFRSLITFNYTSFEGPQVERIQRPFDEHVSALGGGEPVHKTGALSGVGDFSWDLGNGFGLEAVVSYSDFEFDRYARSAPASIDGSELIIEPRVTFDLLGGRLRGIAGAYFQSSEQDEEIDFIIPSAYHDETNTQAIFVEVDFDMTDQWTLTLGARGEEEDRRRNNVGPAFFLIDLDESYSTFLPKLGLAWSRDPTSTFGFVAVKGYNGGGAGFTFEPPFVNFTFRSEEVWDYEVYWRKNFHDDLTFTTNVFYSDYDGMQIPFDLNPDPLLNSQIILNADQVNTYGAEFGLQWQANPSLELFAEVGVLETDVSAQGQVIDNTELTRAASFTGNAGIVFHSDNGFELSADARYSGDYFSDEINDPRGFIDPYWFANAQVAYNWNSWRFHVSCTNVFDNGDPLALFYGQTMATDNGFLLQPRRFIAGVSVQF